MEVNITFLGAAGTVTGSKYLVRHNGHSMLVDPWGEVLAVLPEGEGVVLAEIDVQRLAAVRQRLPALEHRRL